MQEENGKDVWKDRGEGTGQDEGHNKTGEVRKEVSKEGKVRRQKKREMEGGTGVGING